MKRILYSALALSLAIGGVAATKAANKSATGKRTKAYWVLKPGLSYPYCTVASNYTYYSSFTPPCSGNGSICGIEAEPDASGSQPIINVGSFLQIDLGFIKTGVHTNLSGQVFFLHQ